VQLVLMQAAKNF